MPLRLADKWIPRNPIGNWRLPGEPPFAGSRAFEVLFRDLRRYVREEVGGRSFLIAGHRGAGKTAIITHAILKLRNDLLTESAEPTIPSVGRRGRLQRPLMVKMVGQSLLSPPPGETRAERKHISEAADSESQAKSAERVQSALVHMTIALYRALAAEIAEGFAVHALTLSPEDDLDDRLELAGQLALDLDGAPEPTALRGYWDRLGRLSKGVLWPEPTDQTLRQSEIRDQGVREVVALSTAAQAFLICLGDLTEKEKRQENDKVERKTEVRADLKDLLNRLGAIGAGALAGSVVGINANALAGVGTGLLVWLLSGLTLKYSGSRERKSDRSVDYEFLRDRTIQTLDRDLPLVIDRIRHAGLAPVFVIDELDKIENPDLKIAEIIDRLKHLVADYGFFCFLTGRDYYDRVEQRVVDEAYPTEHTYFSERLLVLNRPRDLFDYLVGLVDDEPGDSTHALRAAVFALFVMYRSRLNFTDAAREIARLCGRDNILTSTDPELQGAGRYRLAATIQIAIDRILESKEISERIDMDPAFGQLAFDTLYYLPRCLEKDSDTSVDVGALALERELLKRMTQPRKSNEPPIGKAASAPADGQPRTTAALRRQLFEGMAASTEAVHGADPGTDDASADPGAPTISKSDLRELAGMLKRLVGYLSDFASLKQELETDAQEELSSARAADLALRVQIIVLERSAGLLAPAGPDHVRFAINELARDVPAPPEPVAPVPTPPTGPAPQPRGRVDESKAGLEEEEPARAPRRKRKKAAAEPVPEPPPPPPPDYEEFSQLADAGALLDAISDLLTRTGLAVADLVAGDLLPATISQQLIEGIRSDLAAFRRNRLLADARERALNGYLTVARALSERGDDIAHALVLLIKASATSGIKLSHPAQLARVARYFDPLAEKIVPQPLRSEDAWVTMTGNAESVRDFTDRLATWKVSIRETGIQKPNARDRELWNHWLAEIKRVQVDGGRGTEPVTARKLDTEYAAAGLPPGILFRLRLSRMDLLDWSRAALAALPRGSEPPEAPSWLLFAALLALGFDGEVLRSIRSAPPPWARPTGVKEDELTKEEELIARLVERAPDAEQGVLNIYALAGATGTSIHPGQPVLSVGRSDLEAYMGGLNWLADHDAFGGVTYEED